MYPFAPTLSIATFLLCVLHWKSDRDARDHRYRIDVDHTGIAQCRPLLSSEWLHGLEEIAMALQTKTQQELRESTNEIGRERVTPNVTSSEAKTAAPLNVNAGDTLLAL